MHKWEGGLAVAQTEFKTEQSKGLLFSLLKTFSASATLLLAAYANPPGLLPEQNFALWFGKARGGPAPSKLIWSSTGFPTDVASLPANCSLPARRQRTVEGQTRLQEEEPMAQLCKRSWARFALVIACAIKAPFQKGVNINMCIWHSAVVPHKICWLLGEVVPAMVTGGHGSHRAGNRDTRAEIILPGAEEKCSSSVC